MAEMTIASPAFEDGGPIPEKHGYSFDNVNPPLAFHGLPEGTQTLALIMDDPDAMEPAGKVWDHWVVWNIKPTEGIPEDWDVADAVEGENDYGEIGYGGPQPPDKEHTYIFRVYALDTRLDLEEGASKEELEEATKGHVLGKARMTGTFKPS